MGVEDERTPAAGPVAGPADQADRVDALRRHELQPGLDAAGLQPADDRLADRPLFAGIVGQIAESEAKIDQRRTVAVDILQNVEERFGHENCTCTLAAGRTVGRRAGLKSGDPEGRQAGDQRAISRARRSGP